MEVYQPRSTSSSNILSFLAIVTPYLLPLLNHVAPYLLLLLNHVAPYLPFAR